MDNKKARLSRAFLLLFYCIKQGGLARGASCQAKP